MVLQTFIILSVTHLPASLKSCHKALSLSDTSVTTAWAHRNRPGRERQGHAGAGAPWHWDGRVKRAGGDWGKAQLSPSAKLGAQGGAAQRGWEGLSAVLIPSLTVSWTMSFLILFPPLFQGRRAVREPLALSQGQDEAWWGEITSDRAWGGWKNLGGHTGLFRLDQNGVQHPWAGIWEALIGAGQTGPSEPGHSSSNLISLGRNPSHGLRALSNANQRALSGKNEEICCNGTLSM